MHDFLCDDYNLEALTLVRPERDAFSMFVTPRFVPTYAGSFESLSTRLVKKRLSRCDLFVDVGAHYGYYTLLAAEANRDIHIVAIEPVAENFSVLQTNLRHNGIGADRATCFRAAASSRSGTVQFCKSEASDNGSVVPHPASETLARIEVESIRLDDVIGRENARHVFIKMDTDGHELEVLKGLAGTLDALDDVTVMLEMNPKMMRIAGTSAGEIIGLLHEKGFRLFAIDDQEARFYPLEMAGNLALMQSRYETSFYNVLCVKAARALSVLFFSHATGLTGAERSLLDLIDGLCARGVVCSAVLRSDGPLRGELIDLGCAVHGPDDHAARVTGWWWAGGDPDFLKCAMADTGAWVTEALLPDIRRISPDVIFSQTIVSPWGAVCAEALKIPHVLSARESGLHDGHSSFALGFGPSMRALYECSEAVFCATRDVRETAFANDEDTKTEIVYGHVRLASDRDEPAISLPEAAGARPTTIGIFGTIVAGKGQEDLIRACIELLGKGRNIHCVLAGGITDESYADLLRRMIETSGHSGRFTWAGFVSNPHALMRKMDVLVSCSRKEAFGRTLVEASLLGKPMIFAKAGGPEELFIHGEHGLAYEAGDQHGLASAIDSVINDMAGAEARARRAREHVSQRFNDETYSGAIYARLVDVARKKNRIKARGMSVGSLLTEAGLAVPAPGFMLPRLFFAEEGNGFCEQQTVLAGARMFGPFDITFDLPDNGYTCLRLDPTELRAVTLVLHELIVTAEDGTTVDKAKIRIDANGEPGSGLAWKFLTPDPQVTLRFEVRVRRVRLIGELRGIPAASVLKEHVRRIAERDERLAALQNRQALLVEREQLDQRSAELARAISERDAALDHVAVMINSKSWRLTAPIRAILRLFAGS